MTQVCTLGRWTRKDIFLSHNHACMRRETRELIHPFPLESAFLGGLKTCMATLLLIAKDSDMMVAHYTADLEGPEGKTRYDDWGFLVPTHNRKGKISGCNLSPYRVFSL